MGQKTHPIGFRLGIIRDWDAKWFARKGVQYRKLVAEDMTIRKSILGSHTDAAISKVEIERNANEVIATIHTARPGIVIGRGGQRVDELRGLLEKEDRPPGAPEHPGDIAAGAGRLPGRP